MAMILLLCDVLIPTNILSLSLQDSSINLIDADTKPMTTTYELENIITLLCSNDNSVSTNVQKVFKRKMKQPICRGVCGGGITFWEL